MRFIWDPAKSADCLKHRGFDFNFASRIFESGTYAEWVDESADYGEVRSQVIGPIGSDGVFAVVYTEREDGVVRIISARRAEKQEIKEWRKSQPQAPKPERTRRSTGQGSRVSRTTKSKSK